ncbi:hypothetical protein J8M20_15165 [Pseudoalteromonas luteoviolacea]|uniref:phosphoribosyltransferase-like protein n=1 Tax=Pseudoalteromonas luteoviolacea TaxID=43657 RepID=UPI001B396F15|nr:hypothetical protein [Pseudoalteromonas luteoviolacea]MBQ4812698.1 hypothetical protein [Pseudoalteromonas luteoviolacea]
MELPENWSSFKRIVVEKLKIYCDTGLWPFRFEDLASWLSNFDDEKDEYLALQLLDSLIVRSNDMAKSCYARLLHSSLRQLLLEKGLITQVTLPQWKRKLESGDLKHQLRFASVRTARDDGESGSVIYRLLSSDVDTNKYSLSRSSSLPPVIILIDDFVGSGKQFIDDFAPEFDLNKKLEQSTVIYCPLIAYEDGIENLKEKFPDLHLLPGEILKRNASIFYGDANKQFKNDQVNTVGDVKGHFEKMKLKFAPKMEMWLGFESACLPLAFEWGCPNQTPSIFWMSYSSERDGWKKLFSRRA